MGRTSSPETFSDYLDRRPYLRDAFLLLILCLLIVIVAGVGWALGWGVGLVIRAEVTLALWSMQTLVPVPLFANAAIVPPMEHLTATIGAAVAVVVCGGIILGKAFSGLDDVRSAEKAPMNTK